ncbi:MAG: hypothetical protein NVSMB64_02200 [Candidatus Velthaea sp.]
MTNISSALAGALPAEVDFHATVTGSPRYFTGTHTHARHEAFECRSDDGTQLEIVDNVDLAPPVAVMPGDRITVRGELVQDPGREPLVHWTHHDPAGQHAGGWIDFAGRRYA